MSLVVGGAVAVVAVGGLYRWLRSPSREELAPMDNEVAPWQLDLPDIETTLQMARLAMLVYDDEELLALCRGGLLARLRMTGQPTQCELMC